MEIQSIFCGVRTRFLGTFAKLRKATTTFIMSISPSVRLPACPHGTTSTGRFFKKFDISIFKKKKKVGKIQDSLKSDKNNG
jgi:hypothetical protein